jgi:DNA-binding transcriptional LysR family regulator
MQIETFKVFCDLVETASFSKAAELNSITQSAVSQQIRGLEQKFKVALIERGKKHFLVTAEGRVFLQASKEILRAYDGLSDRLQQLQAVVAGELKIATVHRIGLYQLPRNLKAFRKSFPAVQVAVEYLHSSQVYERVASGDADLGLVAFPSRRTGMLVESYWKDKLVLICHPAHHLAKQQRVALSALHGEPFISFEADKPTREAINRFLKQNRARVRRTMKCNNLEALKRAVAIGHGISIVPFVTVREERRVGTLATVEIDSLEMWQPIGLVQRRNRIPPPVVQAFVTMLKRKKTL